MSATRKHRTDEEPGHPFRTSITKDEINHLQILRYTGPIEVVRTDEALARAVKELRRETVLGFDTETRPSFKKGESYLPSLVQLGGASTVYIFQLVSLTKKRKLFNLLSDAEILKVGVALDFDVRQLQEVFPFAPGGFTNLESITDEMGILNNGLRSLAALILGFRVSKSEQRSNWSRETLTQQQLTYAATDAWVSREIYLALRKYAGNGGRSSDAPGNGSV
jgi:ribonuclease D